MASKKTQGDAIFSSKNVIYFTEKILISITGISDQTFYGYTILLRLWYHPTFISNEIKIQYQPQPFQPIIPETILIVFFFVYYTYNCKIWDTLISKQYDSALEKTINICHSVAVFLEVLDPSALSLHCIFLKQLPLSLIRLAYDLNLFFSSYLSNQTGNTF